MFWERADGIWMGSKGKTVREQSKRSTESKLISAGDISFCVEVSLLWPLETGALAPTRWGFTRLDGGWEDCLELAQRSPSPPLGLGLSTRGRSFLLLFTVPPKQQTPCSRMTCPGPVLSENLVGISSRVGRLHALRSNFQKLSGFALFYALSVLSMQLADGLGGWEAWERSWGVFVGQRGQCAEPFSQFIDQNSRDQS